MALDHLQKQIAETALALPEGHTLALAGGGAMSAHGLVDRATHDVDLFTEIDADEAVRVAAALRQALSDAGLEITPAARPPHATASWSRTPAPGCPAKLRCSPMEDGSARRSASTSDPCFTSTMSPRTRS